jgi:hypothetical protein
MTNPILIHAKQAKGKAFGDSNSKFKRQHRIQTRLVFMNIRDINLISEFFAFPPRISSNSKFRM